MSEERWIQGKYGYFIQDGFDGYVCHTLWDAPNDTNPQSYRGGKATVKVSREALRVMGPDELSRLCYEKASRHGTSKYRAIRLGWFP